MQTHNREEKNIKISSKFLACAKIFVFLCHSLWFSVSLSLFFRLIPLSMHQKSLKKNTRSLSKTICDWAVRSLINKLIRFGVVTDLSFHISMQATTTTQKQMLNVSKMVHRRSNVCARWRQKKIGLAHKFVTLLFVCEPDSHVGYLWLLSTELI